MQHHARLYIGSSDTFLEDIHLAVGIKREEISSNPDIFYYSLETFGIDDARNIITHASQKPFRELKRTFVCICSQITAEAQNALLKLLEDPPDTAQFIFILPSEDAIITTLKSRFEIQNTHDTEKGEVAIAKELLSKSYADRLGEVAARVKEKDFNWVQSVLKGMEFYYRQVQFDQESLEEILFVSEHIKGRGASPKMLLEHLMLSVPKLR